ncbi:ComF family protein [Moraxella macacae]|nr:ComF family protein [Moraxella macacae]
MPKAWWQLPFAGALVLHAKFFNQCQLCQLNHCQPLSIDNVKHRNNSHWFNRLQFLCVDCHQRILWQQSVFSINTDFASGAAHPVIQGIASSFYDYPLNHAMTEFKNHHELRKLMVLVHAIRQLDLPHGCHAQNSAIVIVPTTKQRLIERGFNPLFMLTLYLSFHWQIPIFTQIKREERHHQQGLSRTQRLDNVKNAFYVTTMPQVKNPRIKNLILFDDVVTTGATLQAVLESLFNQIKPSANASPYPYQIHARAILHGRLGFDKKMMIL